MFHLHVLMVSSFLFNDWVTITPLALFWEAYLMSL